MSRLLDHFEKHALLALEKEEKLLHLVDEHLFTLDIERGVAIFGRDLEFSCQLLGTESNNTLTWLWAWSDAQDEVPDHLLRSSLEMRGWGLQEGIPEAVEPDLDLNRADGRMLSIVATEICKASSFYRDPYDGGALYLLLFGNKIDVQPSLTGQRIVFHLHDLFQTHDINPRNALRAYLQKKGLHAEENGNRLSCLLAAGERLNMEFDDQGRL